MVLQSTKIGLTFNPLHGIPMNIMSGVRVSVFKGKTSGFTRWKLKRYWQSKWVRASLGGFFVIVCGVLLGNPQTGWSADSATKFEDIQMQFEVMQQRIDDMQLIIDGMEHGQDHRPMKNVDEPSWKDEYQELSERLEIQEDLTEELDEKVGSRAIVHAFDAMQLDFGGFLHSAFTHIHGDQGSASSFDRLTFEILLKAQLSRRFSAFFAQAFVRESNLRFTDTFQRTSPGFGFSGSGGVKTPLVIAWANYMHRDSLNIQVGRYITPFGIINIEHFPAILLDTEQPQFLRPFSGDTIFPNFITGAQAHGKFFLDEDILQYNLYTGVFTGSTPEQFYSGARVAYTHGTFGATLGLNVGTGKRSLTPTAPDTTRIGNNATFYMYGVDLLIDKGPILWKNELFFTDEDNGAGGNRAGFYTQPAYRITEEWIVFYRYDFLNDGKIQVVPAGGGPRLHTPGNSTEHVVGLNYLPVPNVRLRAIATWKEFSSGRLGAQKADAQIFQLSGTLSF